MLCYGRHSDCGIHLSDLHYGDTSKQKVWRQYVDVACDKLHHLGLVDIVPTPSGAYLAVWGQGGWWCRVGGIISNLVSSFWNIAGYILFIVQTCKVFFLTPKRVLTCLECIRSITQVFSDFSLFFSNLKCIYWCFQKRCCSIVHIYMLQSLKHSLEASNLILFFKVVCSIVLDLNRLSLKTLFGLIC